MRVVFAGTPATAVPSLEALLGSGHEVVAAVTRPDAPAGRGRSTRRSAVGTRADDAGIQVLTPGRPSEPDFAARLTDLAPDVVAVVAYGALIPARLLDLPRHGWVNLHFSLLPAWRGAAPVQHAILHGDDITGATTFRLEPALDTGPVYGVLTEPIRPDDTTGTLLDRLATGGAGLLVATLDGIEAGRLHPQPQPTDGVSFAPRFTTDDARVDWTRPAVGVDRLIRAATPRPGAWTTFCGRRLKLGPVRLQPGGAVDAGRPLPADGHLLVGTGTDPVRLGIVQPEGRAPMPAADWARGVRLTAHDRFE